MRKSILSLIIAELTFSLHSPFVAVNPATTEKITVNSIIDVVDSGDNLCTLREAFIVANTKQRSG